MGSTHLTAIAVEKLVPPATGRVEVYDAEVPGLTLRISATGVKSWSFTYRKQERPRRLSLGCYPGVSLKLARDRAREARGEIQRGGDPVADHRAAELDARLNVLKSCVADFIDKYAKPNLKTWEATESLFNRLVIPAWGTRSVRDI